MAYLALYRKYRPQCFSQVIGQETVVKILKNSIINNSVSHAYIFNGPRGTGKTSIAKIFARTVNCENPINGECCNKCAICNKLKNNDIDIIEIDAASNNGVEEIREIRNNVKLSPSIAKYKVYIIDEVHMLSTGAFNALLKTLEEPPKHVIFILATTEIHKIPLTVLSRCQRFDFSKISNDDLFLKLKEICASENKLIDDKILMLIAKLSDGGARDAINLLDQVISMNIDNVDEQLIYDLNGTISKTDIYNLFNSLINNDFKAGFEIIHKFEESGKNFTSIVDELVVFVRNIAVCKINSDNYSNDDQKIFNSFNLNIDQIKLIVENLSDLRIKISKSNNQVDLFEVYFIYLCDLLSKNNKIINSVYVNSKQHDIDINLKKNEDNCLKNNQFCSEESFDSCNKNTDYNSKDNASNIINKIITYDECNLAHSYDSISADPNYDLNTDTVDDSSITNSKMDNIEINIGKIKKIRINNVLIKGNKLLKSKFKEDMYKINDYISCKEYTSLVTLLKKGTIEVASDDYLLFSFENSSCIKLFDSNLTLIEDLLFKVFGTKLKVVAVTYDKWKFIMSEYKKNLPYKNSFKYIEENDIINRVDDFQFQAESIFGKDIINCNKEDN